MTKFTKPYCPTCDKTYEPKYIIGMEIRGVYDGILFWRCPNQHYFHRWEINSDKWRKANKYAQEQGITIADGIY